MFTGMMITCDYFFTAPLRGAYDVLLAQHLLLLTATITLALAVCRLKLIFLLRRTTTHFVASLCLFLNCAIYFKIWKLLQAESLLIPIQII